MEENNSTKTSKSQSYKCANCGAPINYSPGMTSAYCEYCKNTTVIPQDKPPQKKSKKKDSQEEDFSDFTKSKIIGCPKCLAKYIKDEKTEVKNCIFCNADIYNDDVYDGYIVEPSHILPFQINEEQFKENIEKWIKENKLPTPSPFSGSPKISDIHINKIYAPYLINNIDDRLEERELGNPRFDYKKAFISICWYIPSRISDELEPWDRNQLIPKKENDTEGCKLLPWCFIPEKGENTLQVFKDENNNIRDRYHYENGKYSKSIYGVKLGSFILLPIYEYRYTYKRKGYSYSKSGDRLKHTSKVYYIYGNGYTGKIGRNPISVIEEKLARKYKIRWKIAEIIALIVLIIVLSIFLAFLIGIIFFYP